MCKHRIAFTPKYRRKLICNECRKSLGDVFRRLCGYEGAGMIEGHLMPDRVRMLLAIPPKCGASGLMGRLKGEGALMVFDRHANLKHRFGNRRFWSEGYCVSAVGLSEAAVAKYIRGQEACDIALDKLSVKEYEGPFRKG